MNRAPGVNQILVRGIAYSLTAINCGTVRLYNTPAHRSALSKSIHLWNCLDTHENHGGKKQEQLPRAKKVNDVRLEQITVVACLKQQI